MKPYKIDYYETFAPTAKLNIIKELLSITANCNWLMQPLDVKNVFLHGGLEEKVFRQFSLRFEASMGKGNVRKLKKSLSLYNIKQSPRAWFEKITTSMHKLDYKQWFVK